MVDNPTAVEIPSLTDKDNDQLIHSLINTIEGLKKSVTDLQNKELQRELPQDVIDANNLAIKPPHRLKVGKGWRPLLESEILEARQHSDNMTGQAAYLGVSYDAYKKYCKRYNLWKPNPWSKGCKKKYWAPDKGRYPLNQVLEGKFPEYPVFRLKDLLIRSGTKKAECEQCGFSERRLTDNKIPLILNFEDGNKKNHKLENIRLLCYNCTFLSGKGYIRRGKVHFHFSDPDRMQDADRLIPSRF